SGRFVRASKFRHVFGQSSKKELCYENLKITKNAWDSNLIKANSKYIAVNWESSGGGAFAVIPVQETGKAPDKTSLFRGHTATILDVDFNPFDEQMIVSSSDDGRIAIWEIPADYSFHKYMNEDGDAIDVAPVKYLTGHSRKVGHVKFHPLAQNVLASSSLDYTVKIWNLESGKDEITLQHKDLVTCFEFNPNGTLLATTSRDKTIRIWDLATQKVIAEGPGHSGAKPSRICWLAEDRVVTTGFSRMSDRQVGIYDTADLSKPIGGYINIDSSSGVIMPVYDPATKILFLAGKGDGNIRYYEFAEDDLFELSAYQSTDAQRGFAVAPKYTVNVRENEIVRAYKTVQDSHIEPISFVVPRRAEIFQSDIYPDCPSKQAALTAEEFFAGKTVNGPILLSMQSLYDGSEPEFRPSTSSLPVKVTPPVETKKVAKEISVSPVQSKEPTPFSKGKSVDDLLNKPAVDDLLQKAQDLDGEEEKSEGEWGEEEVEIKKETPVEVKPAPVESKKESKKESPVESPVKATPTETKVVEKVSPVIEATPEPILALAAASPAPVTASPAPVTKGATTLKGNVDKLTILVEKLEAQIAKLTETAAEKDDRLAALETKIGELLKKSA
ncbi:hypothetical protein BABINDRAFT_163603, partial [Babjeviella inositovora NRRL Y-12698]